MAFWRLLTLAWQVFSIPIKVSLLQAVWWPSGIAHPSFYLVLLIMVFLWIYGVLVAYSPSYMQASLLCLEEQRYLIHLHYATNDELFQSFGYLRYWWCNWFCIFMPFRWSSCIKFSSFVGHPLKNIGENQSCLMLQFSSPNNLTDAVLQKRLRTSLHLH